MNNTGRNAYYDGYGNQYANPIEASPFVNPMQQTMTGHPTQTYYGVPQHSSQVLSHLHQSASNAQTIPQIGHPAVAMHSPRESQQRAPGFQNYAPALAQLRSVSGSDAYGYQQQYMSTQQGNYSHQSMSRGPEVSRSHSGYLHGLPAGTHLSGYPQGYPQGYSQVPPEQEYYQTSMGNVANAGIQIPYSIASGPDVNKGPLSFEQFNQLTKQFQMEHQQKRQQQLQQQLKMQLQQQFQQQQQEHAAKKKKQQQSKAASLPAQKAPPQSSQKMSKNDASQKAASSKAAAAKSKSKQTLSVKKGSGVSKKPQTSAASSKSKAPSKLNTPLSANKRKVSTSTFTGVKEIIPVFHPAPAGSILTDKFKENAAYLSREDPEEEDLKLLTQIFGKSMPDQWTDVHA